AVIGVKLALSNRVVADPHAERALCIRSRAARSQRQAILRAALKPQALRPHPAQDGIVIGAARAEAIGNLSLSQEVMKAGGLGLVEVVQKALESGLVVVLEHERQHDGLVFGFGAGRDNARLRE